jgi:hypothetical protein
LLNEHVQQATLNASSVEVHKADYSCGCIHLPIVIANQLAVLVASKLKSDEVILKI